MHVCCWQVNIPIEEISNTPKWNSLLLYSDHPLYCISISIDLGWSMHRFIELCNLYHHLVNHNSLLYKRSIDLSIELTIKGKQLATNNLRYFVQKCRNTETKILSNLSKIFYRHLMCVHYCTSTRMNQVCFYIYVDNHLFQPGIHQHLDIKFVC